MKNSSFFVITFLCFLNNLFAQSGTLYKEISQTKTPFIKANLFISNNTSSSNLSSTFNELHKASFVSLNTSSVSALLNDKPEQVQIAVPDPNGQSLELELIRQNVFDDDSKIILSAEKKIAFPSNAIYYRGSVASIEGSIAAISIFENEIIGLISTPLEGNLIIAKISGNIDNQVDQHIIYYERDLKIKSSFNCGTESIEHLSNVIQHKIPLASIPELSCKKVKVYLECDYKLFQDKNSQVTQVTNYMTGLFNVIKTLYLNENVNLEISEIKVWTTQDPFLHTDLQSILFNYANYRKNNFKGNIAQLVTTYTPQQAGGIAFVNALCSSFTSYGQTSPHSFAWIEKTYSSLPLYSWSVEVMAHEMGHNLGSWHTHSCVWGPNHDQQLDNCQKPDIGSCPTGPAPVNGGTVMSYCHLTSYGINFSKGFGPEPGEIIRQTINNASCLDPLFVSGLSNKFKAPYYEGDTIRLKALPADKTKYAYNWFNFESIIPNALDTAISITQSGIYSAAIATSNCSQLTNKDTILFNEVLVNLGCPIIPGKEDTVLRSKTMTADLTAIKDSITFPANIYSSIPKEAKDIYVELVTTITPSANSWTKSVICSYKSPDAIGIENKYYRPAENELDFFGGKKEYHRILGNFDPAGKWYFTTQDDRQDNIGFDARVNFQIILHWKMKDSVTSCTIGLCDGAPRILDAQIVKAKYKWSTGDTTKTIQVDKAGTYSVEVTKNGKISKHEIKLENKTVTYNQDIQLCFGDTLIINNHHYAQSGIYRDTFATTYLCDSVVQSNIHVLPDRRRTEQREICYGSLIDNQERFTDFDQRIIVKNIDGCDSIILIKYKILPQLKINANIEVACADIGASVIIHSITGKLPFQFLWPDGSTDTIKQNVKNGIYTLQISDQNNCTSKEVIEVINYDSISVSSTVSDVLCFGEENGFIQNEIVSGTPPFNFTWSDGPLSKDRSLLKKGKYQLFIIDQHACAKTMEYEIHSPDLLLCLLDAFPSSGNNGHIETNIFGGTQPYSFKWSNGDTSRNITNLAPGDYQVFITDKNGCTTSASTTINQSTATKNVKKSFQAAIQPNPTHDYINVICNNPGKYYLQILDNQGKVLWNQQMSINSTLKNYKIDVQNLLQGNYILHIVSKDDRFSKFFLFVKE